MSPHPSVIVFDVNGTLSDMAPMASRFADVAAAVRVAPLGARLVTWSNGSVQVAEELLTRAGVRAEFERLLSVADAPALIATGVADLAAQLNI